MQWWIVAVVALAIGCVLGFGAGRAWHTHAREAAQEDADVDEALVGVLAVLRSAAVVLSATGEVVRASARAYEIGLVQRDDIAIPAVRSMIEQVLSDGQMRDEEIELYGKSPDSGDSTTNVLQVRVAAVDGDSYLVLADDMSEARRVEAVRRDFVANVSHELKTPVGALSLLAETIEQAADDPQAVRRFSARMRRESIRLDALVRDLIELSRVQSESAVTERSRVALSDVVTEVLAQTRTAAEARNITVSTGGETDVDVVGDRPLLVTALRNLVDNAIKYSGENTRVGVGVSLVDDGRTAEIRVVDQGIGIPPADHERIFERFYRVDPARSRATGGTGLGLSIVKHIVADHGGRVRVWSEPGRGSTFTVSLPVAVRNTQPSVVVAPRGEESARGGGSA